MNDRFDSLAPWNATFAARLPGELLPVGLSYLDADGELIDMQQIFGRVLPARPRDGISLRLALRQFGRKRFCGIPAALKR
jgi:hypothetical protein